MKISTTEKKKSRKRNQWLWFIGIYCVSLVCVGGFMLLTHGIGVGLVKLVT
jgi:hypothetical protein